MLIYVVDDEAHARDYLVRALQNADHTVLSFKGTIEANQYINKHGAPDVMLIDYQFKGQPNGLHLARHIHEMHPRTSVMIVSGVAYKQEIVDAYDCGADDFLFKPVPVSHLLTRVERAFMRRQTAFGDMDRPRQIGALDIDPRRQLALWHGVPLQLTRTEFTLVNTLTTKSGEIINYAALYSACTGEHLDPSEARTRLRTHVANLRHKFIAVDPHGEAPILVVRGVGLRWAPELSGSSTSDPNQEDKPGNPGST